MERLLKIWPCIKDNPKQSAAALSFVLSILAIRHFQKKIIYLPNIDSRQSPADNPRGYRNPTEYRFDQWENIEIQTEDKVKLRGWFIKYPGGEPKQNIVYFQENAGNIGTRLPFIMYLTQRTQSNVMIIAYRGYSDSQGSPSEKGLKKDSVSILRSAVKLSDLQKIPLYVFGRSLGGAAAIHACTQPQFINQTIIKGIIIENTFTSIKDIVLNLITWKVVRYSSYLLLWFLVSNNWNSLGEISKINKPMLFIKSCKDQLIPKHQMDSLEKKSQSILKQSLQIPNGTHNDTWVIDTDSYFQKWNIFFHKCGH